MLSYFEGEEHISQCLHASLLADAVDCVSCGTVCVAREDTRAHTHTQRERERKREVIQIHIDMLKK